MSPLTEWLALLNTSHTMSEGSALSVVQNDSRVFALRRLTSHPLLGRNTSASTLRLSRGITPDHSTITCLRAGLWSSMLKYFVVRCCSVIGSTCAPDSALVNVS